MQDEPQVPGAAVYFSIWCSKQQFQQKTDGFQKLIRNRKVIADNLKFTSWGSVSPLEIFFGET